MNQALSSHYASRLFPEIPGRRDLAILLIFALALAVLKAAILLQAGSLYGRLSVPTPYDDVTYFVDGAYRLRLYYDGGMTDVIKSLFTNPPHAPISTLLAFVGFLVFGVKPIAAYFMNTLPVAISFALIVRLTGLNRAESLLLLLILLGLPIFDYLITTFHPDLLLGVITGLVCLMFLRGQLVQYSYKAVATIGATIALALLVKPTGSPAVIIVVSGALGVALISEFFTSATTDIQKVMRAAAKKILLLVGVVILIAGPYYAQNAVGIAKYIWQGWTTEWDIWYVNRPLADELLYYVDSARNLLGWSFWMLIALFVINVSLSLAANQKLVLLKTIGFALVTFLAYLLPTATSIKSFFFGALFYGLALCCFVFNLQVLSPLLNGRFHRHATFVLLALGVAISVVQTRDNQQRWPQDAIERENRLFSATYSALKEALGALAQPGLFGVPEKFEVLIPHPLGVAPHAYQLAGERERLRMALTGDPRMSKGSVINLLETASAAIIPDSAIAKGSVTFPLYRHLDEIINEIKLNTTFKSVYVHRTDRGNVYVFARKPPVTSLRAGIGWLPLEGPYPKWNLPKVRWMTFPEGELNFESKGGTSGKLVLSCRAGLADTSIEAIVESNRGGQWILGLDFKDMAIPIHVKANRPSTVHIRLRAIARGKDSGDIAGQRAILCRDAYFDRTMAPDARHSKH